MGSPTILRGRLASLLVGCLTMFSIAAAAAAEPVTQATPDDDTYQVFFAIGMEELRRQNYPAAIQVFKMLSNRLDSQRIRLELARAYFLDRQYEHSKLLFNDILADASLPWGVRENVNRYLDLIDEALGSIKFSVAFVTDSNPMNYTESRQVMIAGQVLTIAQPPENEETHGIEYGVTATKAFTADASVVGFAKVSFKDLEGDDFDRWTLDGGIALFPRSYRKLQGRVGIEDSYYAGDHQYRQPYVSVTYFPDPVERFRLSTEARLAYLDVDEYDHLDAFSQTLTARASTILANSMQVLGSVYVENSDADEKPYSYQGAGVSSTVSLPLFDTWGVDLSAGYGTRNYLDDDPFFTKQRRDNTTKLSFLVHNKQWKVFGFTPEFGVAYQHTDSNISFYEFDKTTFVLRAKN